MIPEGVKYVSESLGVGTAAGLNTIKDEYDLQVSHGPKSNGKRGKSDLRRSYINNGSRLGSFSGGDRG